MNPESDFVEERFVEGGVLYAWRNAQAVPLTIQAVRFQRGRPVVTFVAVDSIDEAEWLTGQDLRVPVEALHRLPAGRFYRHDLVGCDVWTTSGAGLGAVVEVEGPAEASRLVVRIGEREVLVPLADEICVDIDTVRRRIVVEPPEGLLDLNESGGVEVEG